MKKIKFIAGVCLLLLTHGTANAQSTVQLPQGTFVSKGVLTAKEGYQFFLSPDKKTAALKNAKDNTISGSFACGCDKSKQGNCFVVVQNNTLFCNGTCSCAITVVVQGNIYTVNLQMGVLELKKIK